MERGGCHWRGAFGGIKLTWQFSGSFHYKKYKQTEQALNNDNLRFVHRKDFLISYSLFILIFRVRVCAIAKHTLLGFMETSGQRTYS